MRRTSRHLSLTDDGKAFHERAKQILRDVEHAASELTERRGTLTGPLRISAPVSFGTLHLGQALFGFLARYPGIELTLELDDRFVDIQGEGYDAIIRHGPVDDDRIIVKRLAASRRVLVASADYLKRCGNPTSLQDLGQHRGIMYGNRGAADWRFRVGRKWTIARPQMALRVNNGCSCAMPPLLGWASPCWQLSYSRARSRSARSRFWISEPRRKAQRSILPTPSICARPGKFAPSLRGCGGRLANPPIGIRTLTAEVHDINCAAVLAPSRSKDLIFSTSAGVAGL
jgi:DNA-binding transcriptional LysR family regulator